jgi:ABC-type transport system involved in multi-copper enzyme maturation permease subunit
LFLVALIGGFGMAYKGNPSEFLSPIFLSNGAANLISLVSILCGIVGILIFSHEYRYNTIMYSLTITNSRSKFLIAKIVVLSVFAVTFVLCMTAFALLALKLGLAARDVTLVTQDLQIGQLLWHGLFTGWGYAMLGLALVALFHNQVFAFVAFLLMPMIVESLLSILLKENAIYLPYTALSAVLGHVEKMSDLKGALVFLAWLIGAWTVSWVLFLRRDAN